MHQVTGRPQKHLAIFSNFSWAPHRLQAPQDELFTFFRKTLKLE